MYAVQRVGDRWLVVSVSEWSLAAGRTFERREIDVDLVGGDLLIRHRYPRARRSRAGLKTAELFPFGPQAATYLRIGPRRG